MEILRKNKKETGEKKYETKNSKGITLVALVLTIIILLILVGISIMSLTNTGLFEKTQEAKRKTEEAEANQKATLDEYETALNQYDENTLAYKVNNGEIKIGDYIKYTPDTASTDAILEELGTYSGLSSNTASTLQQETLNWRILDVKDGQVRLISETPTNSKITLYSAKGYNNAVYLLDKTCKTLYNNEQLASNVQNIKIEDIQDHLTYDYTQYRNSSSNVKYGETREYETNKNYPNLFAKEKNGWVNEIQGTEPNLSEQIQPINETKTTAIQTYWEKTMESSDFEKTKYYEIFINNGSNYPTYWMSSRCVITHSDHVDFDVRNVNSGHVYAYGLYNSSDGENPIDYAFRPCITLKFNIQIDATNTGDGSTPEKAYIIK